MTIDLADHPFSRENIARELGEYTAPSEAAWLAWLATAERLLGHDLDGNDPAAFDPTQDGCGYSLDEALISFERGDTPHAYAVTVGSRERYDHGAFVRA